MLGVPLLREGDAHRRNCFRTTQGHPALPPKSRSSWLRPSPTEAVIAIENTRLFEAEQQRTHELTAIAAATDGHGGGAPGYQQTGRRHAGPCQMAHHQLAYRHQGKAQGAFCCGSRASCLMDHRSGSGTRGNSISPGKRLGSSANTVRREKKYYLANLPAKADLPTLAATVKARWICEQAHQQLKEELGLDHFEGRSWQGLHRHALMTVVIAYAFLQYRRLKTARREKKN